MKIWRFREWDKFPGFGDHVGTRNLPTTDLLFRKLTQIQNLLSLLALLLLTKTGANCKRNIITVCNRPKTFRLLSSFFRMLRIWSLNEGSQAKYFRI
jgi:hypothetical protein